MRRARAIKYTGEYAMYIISEGAAADCVEHYQAAIWYARHNIQIAAGIRLRAPHRDFQKWEAYQDGLQDFHRECYGWESPLKSGAIVKREEISFMSKMLFLPLFWH